VSTLALAPRLLDRIGGEPTLDDVLVGVWEGLAADRVVACPACQGEMEPDYGTRARRQAERSAGSSGRHAGHTPAGGRCTGCGATLR
jgi:hypothetical protein